LVSQQTDKNDYNSDGPQTLRHVHKVVWTLDVYFLSANITPLTVALMG